MADGHITRVTYTRGGEQCNHVRIRSDSDRADVNVLGKVMIVRVPLSAIGLDAHNYQIEFKVTDNVQDMENDPLNLYSTGDAAPIGSLNFSYGY